MPKIKSRTDLYICVAPGADVAKIYQIADELKDKEINVTVDISGRKLSDQLKSLDKRRIPFVTTIGSEELEKKVFVIRNVETRKEKSGGIDEIVSVIRDNS